MTNQLALREVFQKKFSVSQRGSLSCWFLGPSSGQITHLHRILFQTDPIWSACKRTADAFAQQMCIYNFKVMSWNWQHRHPDIDRYSIWTYWVFLKMEWRCFHTKKRKPCPSPCHISLDCFSFLSKCVCSNRFPYLVFLFYQALIMCQNI